MSEGHRRKESLSPRLDDELLLGVKDRKSPKYKTLPLLAMGGYGDGRKAS